jgi:hypothetical protein
MSIPARWVPIPLCAHHVIARWNPQDETLRVSHEPDEQTLAGGGQIILKRQQLEQDPVSLALMISDFIDDLHGLMEP